MKLLIYGSKGWIGKQFLKILDNNNITFIEGKIRVDNNNELLKEIETIKPTHIISFIGRTHGSIGSKKYTTIDYLEQKGKLYENVRDNLYTPLLLAEICKEKKIHYTYLGTGCIFKFDQEHPFGEEINGFIEKSLPNFFGSSYSTVKGFTDRLMHLFENDVLNLRIRMPITGNMNTRNFITKITTYQYICSIPNSMTVLSELLPKVLDMMTKNITGTINLTNPGLISHNQILKMFQEIVDPEFTWKNFSVKQQSKILASDRSNNFLDTSKLEKLYPDVTHIKDAVKDCLIQYKKTYVPKNKIDTKIIKSKENKYINQIQNLLITGGCGFIGSNFINYFSGKYPNITIINIDAMYYSASKENISKKIRNSNNYILVEGNLNSSDLVKHILMHYQIDHVIHFAAQSHVQTSFDDSLQFTSDNIVGTHVLLECCRKYGNIKKFIHVSTDEVYGESMNSIDENHKTEHSILCPTNPYAATKAGAELIAQSYHHSYKMPIIITRGNNVFGPNQYPEKIIPKFIKLLKENKKVTIQGKGASVRAFLHSYDTSTAFEKILLGGKIGEIYNIGCDEGMEYSVMEIAKILIKMIKNTEKYDQWIEYIKDRPFNDQRYYISNQKIKDLGWNIKYNLINGLQDLI
jgi:dTDP-glucose 4,6-dehydratase